MPQPGRGRGVCVCVTPGEPPVPPSRAGPPCRRQPWVRSAPNAPGSDGGVGRGAAVWGLDPGPPPPGVSLPARGWAAAAPEALAPRGRWRPVRPVTRGPFKGGSFKAPKPRPCRHYPSEGQSPRPASPAPWARPFWSRRSRASPHPTPARPPPPPPPARQAGPPSWHLPPPPRDSGWLRPAAEGGQGAAILALRVPRPPPPPRGGGVAFRGAGRGVRGCPPGKGGPGGHRGLLRGL